MIDALVDAATARDGVAPLGENVLLCLHRGDAPDHHRTVLDPGSGLPVGYLHAEPDPSGVVAELVVHPDHRRRGHGRTLLSGVLVEARTGLRAWSHGGLAPARHLAGALRLEPVRELWTMQRALVDPARPLPDVPMPPGVQLRAFRPGADDTAWLALNARAFAHHPEQGRWTTRDLAGRLASPWFDAAGFLVAERDGRLVGYHWTKVHQEHQPPVGEVYVVGVDPGEQGRGLGRALTVAGLRHLAGLGLGTVMLYVDESNTAARRVYEALGFVRSGTDVMYATPTANSSDDLV